MVESTYFLNYRIIPVIALASFSSSTKLMSAVYMVSNFYCTAAIAAASALPCSLVIYNY